MVTPLGWTKRRKGLHGQIYVKRDIFENRAIVENRYGIKWMGKPFNTLQEAASYAEDYTFMASYGKTENA